MKNIQKIITALLVVLSTLSFLVIKPAIKVSADKGKSYLSYHMVHPAHEWDGYCKNTTCNILLDEQSKKISQVGVAANISCFDSDNDNRDSHVLETTEALKYPTVKFLSTSVADQDSVLLVTGNLTFHNVTKKIGFKAQKKTEKNEITISGYFNLRMTEFGIEPPSLMLVSTEDVFKVNYVMVFKVN